MSGLLQVHPKYVTDEEGRKTAVLLSIEEFDNLIEDLGDLAIAAERRDEPSIPHQQVVAELEKDGYLLH